MGYNTDYASNEMFVTNACPPPQKPHRPPRVCSIPRLSGSSSMCCSSRIFHSFQPAHQECAPFVAFPTQCMLPPTKGVLNFSSCAVVCAVLVLKPNACPTPFLPTRTSPVLSQRLCRVVVVELFNSSPAPPLPPPDPPVPAAQPLSFPGIVE